MRSATMHHHFRHLVWFFFTMFPVFKTSYSIDFITRSQYVTKDHTIVSAGEQFELGFFSTNKSDHFYIGICADDGNLVLVDDAGKSIWSANQTGRVSRNTVAELLDNGNFVLRWIIEALP
ncbi:hypothetical protein ACS0TY_031957 [Phlomoides rotata]